MEETETHKREKHYMIYKGTYVMWTVIAGTYNHFVITSTKATSIVKAYQGLIDRHTALLNISKDKTEIMCVSKDLNFIENMMDAIDITLKEPREPDQSKNILETFKEQLETISKYIKGEEHGKE